MARNVIVQLKRGGHRKSHARPALDVARRLRRDGKLDEAEQIFKAHLIDDRTDREAWLGLGLLYESRGALSKAAFCLWRAVQAGRPDYALLLHLGTIYMSLADFRRARIVYSMAIQQRPNDLQAYIRRSVVERLQGDPVQAKRTLHAGVRHNPVSIEYCFGQSQDRILRVQGVENSHFTLTRSPQGAPTISLHLGNFATEYFWNARRFTTVNYFVLDDNFKAPLPVSPCDIIVNTIADPDVESRALQTLARFIDTHPQIPLINNPRDVLETSRDRNYRRLNILGIRFPKTLRFNIASDPKPDFATLLRDNDLKLPVILRIPGSHTAESVVKAETIETCARYVAESPSEEIYVIEYIENRFHGDYYRKMRVFFIDGEIYPVVHHIDREWNVHGFHRTTIMATAEWMMEIERAFITDPKSFLGEAVYDRLHNLFQIVRLDFFGVDFTVTDAGDILIYELNPVMRHSFVHATHFPYLRPTLERITNAFQDMILRRISNRKN